MSIELYLIINIILFILAFILFISMNSPSNRAVILAFLIILTLANVSNIPANGKEDFFIYLLVAIVTLIETVLLIFALLRDMNNMIK